ncbi:hypothetical protein LTR36_004233 [Oleoguttula mirabilis]|uniref:NUC153 domain-containing protein n=1 Tax=Oleoguttula mirabilis TaxID=1507867 RepID=A0AAV9JGX8_9PEZI|nr:hypothetical protein LTR36_004233 [Oleoguttula mirabilis]
MADERFSALARDPRYRLPSRKEARTAVDPRFGRLFTDNDFGKKASVDRYGRKVKPGSGKKEMERLYRLDTETKPVKKGEKGEKEVVGSSEDEGAGEEGSEEEVEDEGVVARRDPARDGGFSESEEEATSEEEGSDIEAELAEETAGQEQTEVIPMGDVTRRIAAVNLDWDNIRASDILAVASSFIPASGRVESVTVYPSEFGRERLQREELEGPPREIFASSKRTDAENEEAESEAEEEESDDGEEDEKIKRQLLHAQATEGQEFDTAALRQYQLERLRYYYAVIACDSQPTAKALYDSMDGREYLSTANFFDLRFIPDDTTFDDDAPRDECTKLPEGYRPNEFRTEALTHSKVRLTWDDDDTTRKEVQKRAFSRAEIDENDLQAYIGSDSSDADSVASRKSTAEDRKAKKQEAQRQKMRAALGLGDEKSAKGKKAGGKKGEPVGDMQITFTSGLTSGEKDGSSGKGVFENEPQDEISTRERYIQKERDRKLKRKEKMKASRTGGDGDADDEEVTAAALNDDAPEVVAGAEDAEDAGFDDPFFNDPSSAAAAEKRARKAERQKKRDARALRDEEAAARRSELELLMADDKTGGDGVRHFDMREIEKAEKAAKRKGKKGSKKQQQKQEDAAGDGVEEGAEGFAVNTEDPRFKGVFESHEYALDPTHPRYKATQGMKALLEEGRKKRKRGNREDEEDGGEVARPGKQKAGGKGVKAKTSGDEEVRGLVARLKGGRKG